MIREKSQCIIYSYVKCVDSHEQPWKGNMEKMNGMEYE